jgi:hypothetical protein
MKSAGAIVAMRRAEMTRLERFILRLMPWFDEHVEAERERRIEVVSTEAAAARARAIARLPAPSAGATDYATAEALRRSRE